MNRITCPLCEGKGTLEINDKGVYGEIPCPLCSGEGKVAVVEDSDTVVVEAVKTAEGIVLLIHDPVRAPLVDGLDNTSVGEATKSAHKFCRYCFGNYVVVNGVVRKCG